ncbi:hypothetical protein NFI96_018784 [Prochilodus magdalenae]|nr:hypothetical protein NFI96_018784 [Prochilodus magdalenae]
MSTSSAFNDEKGGSSSAGEPEYGHDPASGGIFSSDYKSIISERAWDTYGSVCFRFGSRLEDVLVRCLFWLSVLWCSIVCFGCALCVYVCCCWSSDSAVFIQEGVRLRTSPRTSLQVYELVS